jgi:hypothetical protein
VFFSPDERPSVFRSILILWLLAAIFVAATLANASVLQAAGMRWGFACFAVGGAITAVEFGLLELCRGKLTQPRIQKGPIPEIPSASLHPLRTPETVPQAKS